MQPRTRASLPSLICKDCEGLIEVPERWYEYKPETVTENEEVTILWDMQLHTDKELSENKPDIVNKDHANRCCKLIDVSVPSD